MVVIVSKLSYMLVVRHTYTLLMITIYGTINEENMKISKSLKDTIVYVICLLNILLFVYAAVSKLFDFENFQTQIGQSPLLSAIAIPISYAVIILELVIALLLCMSRFRLLALYAFFTLMIMFTVYIAIILSYASYVPCSCGGILEKMGWADHLYFNITFVVMAIYAIVSYPSELILRTFVNWSSVKILLILGFVGSAFTLGLHLFSKDLLQQPNTFVRTFPPHVADPDKQIDLSYNSYYFAGYHNGQIYLGNHTDPLGGLIIDSTLAKKTAFRIVPEESKFQFRSLQLRIASPNFYLMDGTVPCIYGGRVGDWKARLLLSDQPFFTMAEPMDSVSFVLRSNAPETLENILGTLQLGSPNRFTLTNKLLQKQTEGDGIFDTDGTLQYSSGFSSLIYTYLYRNEITVADANAKLRYRFRTIDTFSQAHIKVSQMKSGTVKTIAAPPLAVNLHTAVCDNFLFVDSAMRGKFDDRNSWERSSTIDMYDVATKSYVLSFYIPAFDDGKMRSFIVTRTHVFALIGDYLLSFKISSNLKTEMQRRLQKAPLH